MTKAVAITVSILLAACHSFQVTIPSHHLSSHVSPSSSVVAFQSPPGGVDGECNTSPVLNITMETSILENSQRQLLGDHIDDISNEQDQGGTLGDIMMKDDVPTTHGLVTTTEKRSLSETYGIHHPLDRMIVTANGNLQRLVSSYYDSPVHVQVDYCRKQSGAWDRQVSLKVYDQVFCTAISTVQVHSKECADLVESGKVGLGQLFRYLDILPEFALQDAGYKEGAFWRKYVLFHPKYVTCHIHEVFCSNVWELKALDGDTDRE